VGGVSTESRAFDLQQGERAIDAAIRMVNTDIPKGVIYPASAGPFQWQRAAALAQVEQAVALNRIAVALEVIAFPPGGARR
jgi:hypothetical protein